MILRQTFCAATLAAITFTGTLCGGEPKTIGDADFYKLHKMIKTQPGESRWMQIPWLTSVWEARQQAAKEGKPIYIWAGSGGGPVGVC